MIGRQGLAVTVTLTWQAAEKLGKASPWKSGPSGPRKSHGTVRALAPVDARRVATDFFRSLLELATSLGG